MDLNAPAIERYNIRGRAANIPGMTLRKLTSEINRRTGYQVSDSELSDYRAGRKYGKKAEIVLKSADTILLEFENRKE